MAFEVMLGSLTVAGSFVAAGKLQEVLPSKPLTYRGQNAVNFGLLAVILVILGAVVAGKGGMPMFYTLVALAFIAGISLVLPIGGADMPVVVALLNSYPGSRRPRQDSRSRTTCCWYRRARRGDSASMLMSKAMNRCSRTCCSAFGRSAGAAVGAGRTSSPPRSAEDAAVRAAYASNVVVVPAMAWLSHRHSIRYASSPS